MTSKLVFETDQDDETIRSLIISAARLGIYFKSCRADIEQSSIKMVAKSELHIYSNGYSVDMNRSENK